MGDNRPFHFHQTTPYYSCTKGRDLMTRTELQDAMTITLQHDGLGMAKFTPAVEGRVWYDAYFQGALVSTMAVPTDTVADLIMDLMSKGYYVR